MQYAKCNCEDSVTPKTINDFQPMLYDFGLSYIWVCPVYFSLDFHQCTWLKPISHGKISEYHWQKFKHSSALLNHPAGTSVISTLFEGFYNSGVWENVFWSNDQCIWHENNIAQIYSISGTAELCRNFSSWLSDVPDIYRFPIVHMVKTHFLLKNLWISGASLGILEKF